MPYKRRLCLRRSLPRRFVRSMDMEAPPPRSRIFDTLEEAVRAGEAMKIRNLIVCVTCGKELRQGPWYYGCEQDFSIRGELPTESDWKPVYTLLQDCKPSIDFSPLQDCKPNAPAPQESKPIRKCLPCVVGRHDACEAEGGPDPKCCCGPTGQDSEQGVCDRCDGVGLVRFKATGRIAVCAGCDL